MAPRGSRPALLLPLALLMACLALASGHFPKQKCDPHLLHHWDYPKSPPSDPSAYCNEMTHKKGIPEKPVHIFIHERMEKICHVCCGGGKPRGGGWFESTNSFSITRCTWNPAKHRYSGKSMSTKIILKCVSQRPVDIHECIELSSGKEKGDGEQCESWCDASARYMAPDSSSASEPWAEDSDVPSSPPSAAFSAHCEE